MAQPLAPNLLYPPGTPMLPGQPGQPPVMMLYDPNTAQIVPCGTCGLRIQRRAGLVGAAYCSERCHRADGWRRKAEAERAPYMLAQAPGRNGIVAEAPVPPPPLPPGFQPWPLSPGNGVIPWPPQGMLVPPHLQQGQFWHLAPGQNGQPGLPILVHAPPPAPPPKPASPKRAPVQEKPPLKRRKNDPTSSVEGGASISGVLVQSIEAETPPTYDDDGVSDAWRVGRALVVDISEDARSEKPVANASRALNDLLKERAPSRATKRQSRGGTKSFASRFAECARHVVEAHGVEGRVALGWAGPAAGTCPAGALCQPRRLLNNTSDDVAELENSFLAPLLEAIWDLHVAASTVVPKPDADRFRPDSRTDGQLDKAFRMKSSGWSTCLVHVAVVSRQTNVEDIGTVAPQHCDVRGVAPILVLNVGDANASGGRLCLLEEDARKASQVHAEAQANSRRPLTQPEPPQPLVVPTDLGRATCVFADFGTRPHAQLPYENISKISGEAIRVTVLPFCQGGCVDWSACLGRRPQKTDNRFAHCAQCHQWAQLGDEDAAPTDQCVCASCSSA